VAVAQPSRLGELPYLLDEVLDDSSNLPYTCIPVTSSYFGVRANLGFFGQISTLGKLPFE